MMGGVFFVIIGMMFDKFGVKGVGGFLGGVVMVLSVIFWVLVFFGEIIWGKSKVMNVSFFRIIFMVDLLLIWGIGFEVMIYFCY